MILNFPASSFFNNFGGGCKGISLDYCLDVTSLTAMITDENMSILLCSRSRDGLANNPDPPTLSLQAKARNPPQLNVETEGRMQKTRKLSQGEEQGKPNAKQGRIGPLEGQRDSPGFLSHLLLQWTCWSPWSHNNRPQGWKPSKSQRYYLAFAFVIQLDEVKNPELFTFSRPILNVATPAEPRGEEKHVSSANLGGEKLLETCQWEMFKRRQRGFKYSDTFRIVFRISFARVFQTIFVSI